MNVPNTGILPYALTNTLHICPIACLQEKEKEKEKEKRKREKKIKKKKEKDREREKRKRKEKGTRMQYSMYVLFVCKILKCFSLIGLKL